MQCNGHKVKRTPKNAKERKGSGVQKSDMAWYRDGGHRRRDGHAKKRCLHCKIQLTFYDNMILQSKKYFSKEILGDS